MARIEFTCSDEQKERWSKAAKADRRSLSQWLCLAADFQAVHYQELRGPFQAVREMPDIPLVREEAIKYARGPKKEKITVTRTKEDLEKALDVKLDKCRHEFGWMDGSRKCLKCGKSPKELGVKE